MTNVIEKERITTTLTRAKAAKPLVEQMITLGKRDTLHTRRQAAAYLMTPGATKKLFADIAPRFSDRAGMVTLGSSTPASGSVTVQTSPSWNCLAQSSRKRKRKTKPPNPNQKRKRRRKKRLARSQL